MTADPDRRVTAVGYDPLMASPVLLCTDGSHLSLAALADGIAVLRADSAFEIVTVSNPPDPAVMAGTGFASGLVTQEEFDEQQREAAEYAAQALQSAAAALDLTDAPTTVLTGDPAAAICEHAEEVGAAAIVIGSRGNSGLKRAVLGSVSDHVLRHAPCPVIVTHPDED